MKNIDSEKIHIIRHSLAHIMASAVLEMFPKANLGVGPVIDNGFYYDFLLPRPLTPEDMKKIEKRMRELIKQKLPFERQEMSLHEAKTFFAHENQSFKVELLKDIEKFGTTKTKEISKLDETVSTDLDPKLKDKVSIYRTGKFVDLCRGPHVKNTSEIPIDTFKIDRTSGAYWRGDQKNPQMQRIYGLAFETKKDLEEFLHLQEEAEKRDHRKLGQDLKIFIIDEMVGKGLPLWLPAGMVIRNEIEKLAIEKEEEYGYVRVATPHLAKKELYLKSGHLPYYEESMYPAMKMDDGTYYLKAMNCPHHHIIYKSQLRSYRELPLRLAEYGTVYRNELSGTLAGLLRVRMLSMNDAHIYCAKEQIESEIRNVVKLTLEYFKIFGLKDYWFRLSKWDPKNKDKYIDEPKNWKYSEDILRKVLKELKVKFVEADNEAAFYGPKIDVQFTSVVGREETMSTIQLDFAAKKRFNLTYKDKRSQDNNEVFVIHRAPLSVHERFMAFLLEQYAGAFPVWLSPVQATVLPISEKQNKYAEKISSELKEKGIRVKLDDRSESIGKKIREAEMQKIPYMLIVGEKEVKGKNISVRARNQKDLGNMKLDKFLEKIKKEIKTKSL